MTEQTGPESRRSTPRQGPLFETRELALPRHLQAPSRARRALESWYRDRLKEQELAAANIVLSELVNNALVHGVGMIRMATRLDTDRLLIEVTDEGSGFQYMLHDVPPDQEQGRGLAIVDAYSRQWGISQGSTHVWAEIERSAATSGEPTHARCST